MSRRFRRIVLDDSSDISMMSTRSDLNNSSSEQQVISITDNISTTDCKMEQSIRDVSQALENMSVVEGSDRVELSQASERSRATSEILEYEGGSSRGAADENSYVEDSFLVKDSEYDDDDSKEDLSAFECNEVSAIGELPSPSVVARRETRTMKFAESTPIRPRPLKPLKSIINKTVEKSQHSTLFDTIHDEESRHLLLELYPEVAQSSQCNETSQSPTNHSKKSEVLSSEKLEDEDSSDEENRKESDDDEGDSDYERFLERVKDEEATKKSRELRQKEDLDDFIVDDDESLSEYELSSDSEQAEENNVTAEAGEISLKNFRRIKVSSEHGYSDEEKENRKALVEYIPPSEKRRRRKGLIRLFTDDVYAEEVLKERGLGRASRKEKEKRIDDEEKFLKALSPDGPEYADAKKFLVSTKFVRVREELTKKLFDIYRRRCFDEKLDADMRIEWNARLRLTAGRCRCMRNGSAIVELSTKVCNTAERVRDTLLHELCHAAVWVIDHVPNGRHGTVWKYWAMHCMSVFNSLPPIERCHNYKIDAKFLYVCSGCGQTLKRHTKSFDTNRKVCAICRGQFVVKRSDGKAITETKQISKFAEFVKNNYGQVKKNGMKHADVMKILGQKFKQSDNKEAVIVTESDEVVLIE